MHKMSSKNQVLSYCRMTVLFTKTPETEMKFDDSDPTNRLRLCFSARKTFSSVTHLVDVSKRFIHLSNINTGNFICRHNNSAARREQGKSVPRKQHLL